MTKTNVLILVSICSLFVFSACGVSQNTNSYDPDIPFIDGEYLITTKSLEVDKLDQCYVIDQQNQVLILNPNQTRGTRYQNNKLGELHSIDVSNPQKILLFYRNNQQIIVLDNVLTETNRINLAEWGYNDVEAVAHTNDNNIWLYDAGITKLVKISFEGDVIFESNTMRDFYLDQMHVLKIVEAQNQVFVLTESDHFQIFDNYAQYIKPLNIEPTADFQTDGSFLTYIKDEGVYSYSIQSLAYYQDNIDFKELGKALQVRKTKTKFILRFADKISILDR